MGTDIGGIAGQIVNRSIPDADHTGTAPGALRIKFNDLVGNFKIVCHSQMHGRQIDSVFNFK
jgi:hypothetical protein